MRAWLVTCLVGAAGCSAPAVPPSGAATAATTAPVDATHKGVIGPHGDHTPRHGGFVLMNGDVHYEVVLASDGRHAVWFSDAVRSDLPASLARDVTMQVSRPDAPVEHLTLQIDDAGESWVARGRPVGGDNVVIKLRFVMQGEPHEVEIPFVPARQNG